MPKLSSHRTCSVTSLPGWKSPFTHRVSSKFLGLAFKDLDQASDCFFGPVHLLCSSLGCVLSHLGTASYLVPVGLLLSFLSFLKVLFIYLFFERKRGRETSMCGCLSCTPNWGPGPQSRHMPYWESNWQPFGSQANAQSTDPHQPGLSCPFCLMDSHHV